LHTTLNEAEHKFDTLLSMPVRSGEIGIWIGLKRLDILATTVQITMSFQEFGGAVSVDAAWLCKTLKASCLE
jgi:hypothetical protein